MTARALTAAEQIAAIREVQARSPHPGNPRDEASDGPGERVVTADLDEWRAAEDEDRRWRQWP